MEKRCRRAICGQNTHKGYDFYSFHAQMNDIFGFKTIVVGDSRLFGQGLVLGSAFGMGKSSYVLKTNTVGNGLKKYSSTNESSFRGVGATIRFGKIDLTAFYSNKILMPIRLVVIFRVFTKQDFTERHRVRKRATVNEQIAGLNASLMFRNTQVGFTLVQTRLNQSLIPEFSAYNHFYFTGNKAVVGRDKL